MEKHHVDPKYMGGPKDGALVPIDAAYHQEITNEFRNYWPYGMGKIDDCEERKRIMDQFYDKFPLPKDYTY